VAVYLLQTIHFAYDITK